MTKHALGIMPLAAALMLAGCLQKETTHTLYLSPDGGVRWTAIESDVRSDEADPAVRRAQEDAYIASAGAGAHALGLGLAALDPVRQRTRVIRGERPFVVATEAQFPRIDRLFERVLADLRVPGYATMTQQNGTTTLLVHLDLAAMADDADIASPVTALCEDLARYRIVLTDGRFLQAGGLTLSDDGMIAVPIAVSDDDLSARGGVVVLTLTWETAGPRPDADRGARPRQP